MNATDWVAEKLTEEKSLKVIDRTPANFLVVKSEDDYTFLVAVLGIRNVIEVGDVQALFAGPAKPELVVNVPSKVLWSGAAIDFLHAAHAAFGTLGDIARAANTKAAGHFRDKNMGFFINAMEQHKNVSAVSYIYDNVFRVERRNGARIVVAVIDTYNMSAEDVRNAKARYGDFDVIVKSSSYGSITPQAGAAAESIGAQALTFAELMQHLSK